ncbi:MAG: hypothetical protein AAGF12_16905 [Myxococcota bacterium]
MGERSIDWTRFEPAHFGGSPTLAPHVTVCLGATAEGALVYTHRSCGIDAPPEVAAGIHAAVAVPALLDGVALRSWLQRGEGQESVAAILGELQAEGPPRDREALTNLAVLLTQRIAEAFEAGEIEPLSAARVPHDSH